jgi:hypothetical protein
MRFHSGPGTSRSNPAPANSEDTRTTQVFPPIGSPAFIEWAKHDSESGHATNALQVLVLLRNCIENARDGVAELPPLADMLSDLDSIRRRLAAVIELRMFAAASVLDVPGRHELEGVRFDVTPLGRVAALDELLGDLAGEAAAYFTHRRSCRECRPTVNCPAASELWRAANARPVDVPHIEAR